MKSGKLFMILLFVGACLMAPGKASATVALDMQMTAESAGSGLLVGVHRTNSGFGLSGLSYNLQFSESLLLSREYSNYGWKANDGIFDISNPVDVGVVDGSAPGWFTTIRFDTVADPPGSEFSIDTSGIVEALTINVNFLPERWIYFDLSGPSASNGQGQDLVTTLGGSINIIDNVVVIPPGFHPQDPEIDHTLAVYVPEPTTLMLFALGGTFLLKKRKT